MTILELSQQAHVNAVSKGFWDKSRNLGEMLMLITSELSEAMEADRKGRYTGNLNLESFFSIENDDTFKEVYDDHIKGTYEEEIADAAIRLFDTAFGYLGGMDLTKHIQLKMRYNSLRPHMHGKKY